MGPVEIGQTALKHVKFSAEVTLIMCVYMSYTVYVRVLFVNIYIQKFMYLNAPGFKGQRG